MRTNDARFRSMIANVEKASTGEMLKNVLAKYDPPYDVAFGTNDILNSSSTPTVQTQNGWSGAFVTLNDSHYMNVTNGTDPSFFIDPIIGPGDKLIDFDPNYKYVDQDGNPVEI